jgi:ergothioneine biosynthesis protein EgtB
MALRASGLAGPPLQGAGVRHRNGRMGRPLHSSSRDFVPSEARALLTDRYHEVRAATERLCMPLSPEDCQVQSMDDTSPTKWHLAHTTWFFETFVLERWLQGYRVFDPAYRVLFNSYYEAVGRRHPRPQRGLLSRPALADVHRYRAHVDAEMARLLESGGAAPDDCARVTELGLHHEQQHQELILTDIKHLFSCNPLRPSYGAAVSPARADAAPLRWHDYGEGVHWIGHAGDGFAFDNEAPRHQSYLRSFALASRPLSNAEYLAFIDDGGYERPDLWLSDGWQAVQSRGWRAPLYWEQRDGEWHALTLAGLQPLRLDAPVCHVSFYEAAAIACWSGARLPTEAEWEIAAAAVPTVGNFVESAELHPGPVRTASPAADTPQQLFGDVWEWTRSAYEPYPGYRPAAGALGEYNGKFMCNQLVLRGGSCVTPASHIRATYRNFFPPDARWQFSGVRLARDLR